MKKLTLILAVAAFALSPLMASAAQTASAKQGKLHSKHHGKHHHGKHHRKA